MPYNTIVWLSRLFVWCYIVVLHIERYNNIWLCSASSILIWSRLVKKRELCQVLDLFSSTTHAEMIQLTPKDPDQFIAIISRTHLLCCLLVAHHSGICNSISWLSLLWDRENSEMQLGYKWFQNWQGLIPLLLYHLNANNN